MQTRPLGQSGIDASVVAFGAWAIGGWMWGGTSEADSIRAIHAAIDAGINLIDTAPVYGFGASEEIVGRAVADRRDRVVLATKCGMVCNTLAGEHKFRSTSLGMSEHGHIDVRVYNAPDSIRAEVEGSLARLGTDHIDLYQTHWQDSTTKIEDTMDALLGLKQAGKIRAIGVCNASAEQMGRYWSQGPLDSDQEKFSMIDRQIEQDQLPFCRERKMAVLAYSPMSLGLLTGKVGPEREFEVGDIRRIQPRFSKENRQRVADMLDELWPIAESHHLSLAQLAIVWTIHQPGLTHALCGARNEQQAIENAAAGDVQLAADEILAINNVLARYREKIV